MKIKATDYINTGEPLVLNGDSTLDAIRHDNSLGAILVRKIGEIVHSKKMTSYGIDNRYIIGQVINDAVFDRESQDYTVEIQLFTNNCINNRTQKGSES